MKTYRTSEVAREMGVHPNTVRLYESLGLIPPPRRAPNGYRIFTDYHLALFALARTAFQIEVLQNGLRKKIVDMVKVAASGDFDRALLLTREYLAQVRAEEQNAEEAVQIVRDLLSGQRQKDNGAFKRAEVSRLLCLSPDTLRNWEMNGLLAVKRKENGYRVYTQEDLLRLKIIRSLRCANYSLEAILRMLHALDEHPDADLRSALSLPEEEEILSVCDRLAVSLQAAHHNGNSLLAQLKEIQKTYSPS